MRTLFYATTLGLALAAAACAAGSKPPETKPAAAAPEAPPPGASLLANTRWTLNEIAGREAIDRVEATLAFDNQGGVSGSGSCNQFHGTATVSGASITFGPLATTRMACIAPINEQEATYLAALARADRFEIEEPYLIIHLKGGDKPLRFIRAANQ
jgi:heat shock protein HslJ